MGKQPAIAIAGLSNDYGSGHGLFALYPKLTGAKVLDYLADLWGGVDPGVRDARAGIG